MARYTQARSETGFSLDQLAKIAPQFSRKSQPLKCRIVMDLFRQSM
jgi:hypothetical protein